MSTVYKKNTKTINTPVRKILQMTNQNGFLELHAIIFREHMFAIPRPVLAFLLL